MKKIDANDPIAQSADMVADNLSQLQSLFPEAFSEGKIQFDTLRQLLGGTVDEADEKYGLNWHGKRLARQIALTPSTGTLRPCPDESVDWDTTQNLMIEGDNLEVMKLLQKSYAGKVKLIYIDPPYNTGHDFVYPDNFRDSIGNYLELTGQVEGGAKISANTDTSGRFHTDWLNMIYPRLKLARNLLRNDGVILISIDDVEVGNLRQTCNEVFGEENLVACLVWEKGRKNDAKLFSVGHEYVLAYAKSLAHLREIKTLWREEKPGAREIWEKYVELRKQHGQSDKAIENDLQIWFAALPKANPSKKWSRYKRVDSNGPWRDRDISWPGGGGPRYDVLHPKTGLPCKIPESGWRFSEDVMKRQIALGLVEFRSDESEPPFRKAHIRPVSTELFDDSELSNDGEENDGENENESDGESEDEFATQVRGSCFYKQSQVSVKHLRSLMGEKVFNNPKDHVELARLFDYVCRGDKEAVVMDFFAGSGSSGHAVLELNRVDEGQRRFILVQLPEFLDVGKKEQKVAANYCEKIERPTTIAELTKERLRRASKQIRDSSPLFGGDVGFRTFKLDKSNIREWSPDREDLTKTLLDNHEHILEGRSEADIVYELLLKLGLDLCVPIESRTVAGKTVGAVGGGVLMLCLAEKISAREVETVAAGIVSWHKELAPAGDSTVVFRDSAFADDVAKTNMAAILAQNGLENVRSL